ncbi:hypothetical protein H9P43_005908 [Blastocladiella emersonii ATCC 22665]|nr:hypothetical protein H9P43_005908 [Blastocladiella emersonii ATCC 22665]
MLDEALHNRAVALVEHCRTVKPFVDNIVYAGVSDSEWLRFWAAVPDGLLDNAKNARWVATLVVYEERKSSPQSEIVDAIHRAAPETIASQKFVEALAALWSEWTDAALDGV